MSNAPFFNRDEVLQSGYLARIIRAFAYGIGLTVDQFSGNHLSYSRRRRLSIANLNNARNNDRSAMSSDTPTFTKVASFLVDVMRMEIVCISFTLRSKDTGEYYRVKTTDIPGKEPGELKPLPADDPEVILHQKSTTGRQRPARDAEGANE